MELFRLAGIIDLLGGDMVVKQLQDINGRAQQTGTFLGNLTKRALEVAAGFGLWQGAQATIRSIYDMGIGLNSRLQQAAIAFETMTGSGEKARQLLSQLQDFAAKTPFEFPELVESTQRMMALGFSAEEVLPTLRAVGDAAAAMGQGSDGVNRIILALGQMQAKGKVSAEEMRQLTEAGIGAWRMLADALGVSTRRAMELAEKGLIPADRAVRILIQGMAEEFPDMMERQSKSFAGLLSTLRDNVSMAFAEVLKPAFEWLANEMLPRVVEATGKFTEALREGGLAGALKTLLPDWLVDTFIKAKDLLLSTLGWLEEHGELVKTILVGIAAGFAALQVIQTIIGLVNTFHMVMGGIGALTNPINLVVMAVGVLAAAAYTVYKNWDNIKAWFQDLWEKVVGVFNWAKEQVLKVIDKVLAPVQWLIDKIQSALSWLNKFRAQTSTSAMGSMATEPGISLPVAMQTGGIVRRPTVALIGEAGPEAVIPLRYLEEQNSFDYGRMAAEVGSAVYDAIIEASRRTEPRQAVLQVDGRTLARVLIPSMSAEYQRLGVQAT